MKFFFDNCLSPKLARAIGVLDPERTVKHLRDRFEQDTEDPVWLGTLGREGGRVIISGDSRIPKNPQNRAAWRQSGLTAFFFKKSFPKLERWEQAWRALRWWPFITAQAELATPGAGFWIPHGKRFGKFESLD